MPELYVQRDQPPGVPPLHLTGERTLPDVPEENYWFQRHLVVYEWIANRTHGRRVVDLASGEGYGSAVLARTAQSVVGVDANPEAFEHAVARYPSVTFERNMVELWRGDVDCVVFLQTIEHIQEPDAMLAHVHELIEPDGVAYISTPNVLTLAPKGAERSGNPWHVREYKPEEYRALCERHFGRVDLLGLFHAGKLRAHELALKGGWDRVHKTLHVSKPFYDRFTPAISTRDFVLRRDHLERSLDLLAVLRPVKLSIVLHTHMPYVEGFGTWPFGEEWLWEAIATSYLPLLDVLDTHPGTVTLSITPVLADQLEAPGALDRCLAFLREVRPASHALDLAEQPLASLEYSAARYAAAADALERRGDLIAAFAPHVNWTSAATHAVLPLLATDAGVRLQLETGIASHRRRFGAWHGGFWLPECAHAPWLDELLEEAGVHVTCVEWPGPGPFCSEAGVVLVPLDRTAMDRVWHTSGYPSHGDYRDTHRLTPRAHQAWANDGTPYDPERGAGRAREHARQFVDALEGHTVVAFDTELFGHFWHEGPIWLEHVLELADVVGVPEHASEPAPDVSATSWGRGRDLRTWSATELAWSQRRAELSALGAGPSDRALRELLALQSSDWAFLITEQTAGDYPRERADAHHAAFEAALRGDSDPALRNLAPELANWAFVQP